MAQGSDAGTVNLRMSGTEWALLLTLSGLWGGSFFFFKVLVAEVPPITVALGRVAIAALALNLLLALRRDPMPTSLRTWCAFTAMGMLNNVIPFALLAWGETRITSGLASILNATTPIFAVIVAHFLTRDEKLSWARSAGVVFAFLGVAVLIGPDALRGMGGESLPGEIACLLAAVSYAFAGIYGRRFKGIPPLKVATGQITGSTLVLIPLSALVDRPWTLAMPSAAVWGAFLGISLICTALAYILYFRILARAGATNLMLVTLLLPVSALILGAVILGEQVEPQAFAGMGLIALGLACIDGRVLARIRSLAWRSAAS